MQGDVKQEELDVWKQDTGVFTNLLNNGVWEARYDSGVCRDYPVVRRADTEFEACEKLGANPCYGLTWPPTPQPDQRNPV